MLWLSLFACDAPSTAVSVPATTHTVSGRRAAGLGEPPPRWEPPEHTPLGTGTLTTDSGGLVLRHTHIDAEVSAGLALVSVVQDFTNPFSEPIDATYVLPLPPDAAVSGFQMACGDRVIEGEVKDRAAAREAFEQARQSGQRAALLEQMRENLFRQEIAGICPGEDVEVTVSYVQQVARDSGRAVLAFPTTVGERYDAPADLTVPTHVDAPEEGGRSLTVTALIDEGMSIQQLWSDSHAIEVWDEDSEQVSVTLDPADGVPDRDVVLTWTLAADMPRAAATVQPPTDDDAGYVAVSLEPQLLEELDRQRKRELLFVLDSSCSMMGQPWETATATVGKALDQMAPDDTFNLVRFASNASSLFATPQPVTDDNIAAAKSWMASPPGGGTEMTAGVLHSLHMPGDDEALRLILMLTDGYIGREKDIVEVVDENLGDARIFSLGVGSSVNRLLLENLAEVGRGSVAYQLPDASIDDTVDDFYDRIAHPAMTDISLDFGGLDVWDSHPSRVPDLWAGQPLRVVARYRGSSDKVRITGLVGGEEVEIILPLDLEDAEVSPAVSTLWARRAIHDISYDLSLSSHEQEAAITPLAIQHHLVSDYTSLVAIESEPSPCGTATHTVDIAHYTPEGVLVTDPEPAVVQKPRSRRPVRPSPRRAAPPAVAPAVPMEVEAPEEPAAAVPEVAEPIPTIQSLSVTGSLSEATARTAIQRLLSQLSRCTGDAFTATLTVDADGRVSQVVFSGHSLDAGTLACLEGVLRRTRLDGAGTVRVRVRG